MPTLRQESLRSRNEKSLETLIERRKCTRSIEFRRSDFKEAKHTCKRLYHEYTAITGSGNKPTLQSNRSDKGAINSSKVLKNTHIDLMLLQDGDTIFLPQRIRLHLRHHDGNQAVTFGQHGTGTHGTLHHGVNSDYFIVPDERFSLAGNAICQQSTAGVNSTPSAHTFFSCAQFVSVYCQSFLSSL